MQVYKCLNPVILLGGSGSGGRSGLATRPTNLPTEHRRFHHRNGQTLVSKYLQV
jgi:hypothetical protein